MSAHLSARRQRRQTVKNLVNRFCSMIGRIFIGERLNQRRGLSLCKRIPINRPAFCIRWVLPDKYQHLLHLTFYRSCGCRSSSLHSVMLASFVKCLHAVQHAVMPQTVSARFREKLGSNYFSIQQPLAIQGLQALIRKLQLQHGQSILSEVSCRLISFGEGKVNLNGPQKRHTHVESANAQMDPTYPAAASARIAELEHEMEALLERVIDLECRMTEVMIMCNGQGFPVYKARC
jgi:hypothetical protein